MEEHIFLKTNMFVLRLAGVLPFTSKNPVLDLLYSIYSSFSSLFLCVFVASQFVEVIRMSDHSFTNVISNLAVSLLYLGTVLKTTTCRTTQIRKLVDEVLWTERKMLEHGNRRILKIYEYHSKWNQFRYCIFFSCV